MDEAPPRVEARFFYASLLAIDDPLSPVPPPSSSSAAVKFIPRPFSAYDNDRLEHSWHRVRKDIFKREQLDAEKQAASFAAAARRRKSPDPFGTARGSRPQSPEGRFKSVSRDGRARATTIESLMTSEADVPATTGTPFIRAPSRKHLPSARTDRSASRSRPQPRPLDSYKWDDVGEVDHEVRPGSSKAAEPGPSAKIAVGVSRLHQVVMPELIMEPIYWSPINDIARAVRATWFYADTMLPVEVPVANMLELGYTELGAWTQTWQDELDSAIRVGAVGEERILRKLWPDETRPIRSAASSVRSFLEQEPLTPEMQREKQHEEAARVLNNATGPDGPDNRSSGIFTDLQGGARAYSTAGVIYVNADEARILKPSLQPSSYFGRRPLANYIRKGHKLGVHVVRGFDQAAWDRLYPSKKTAKSVKAHAGASTSADRTSVNGRRLKDPELAEAVSPKVTDLVLVIHGIGQKLSERMESFHFTHAMNAFRREVNVELGSDAVRARLRKDAGGIMLLPVNWRQTLTFEEGGYRGDGEDPGENTYGIKDITPDTLTSVRNIVSDVMLDIPYYLSHHKPKMVAAVVNEANRIYKLWCENNPSFHQTGRVHVIAHSLGSIMALDILSNQPTRMPPHLWDPTKVDPTTTRVTHFLFSVSNLFFAGSPSGLFLLLQQSGLRPRGDHPKADEQDTNISSICGVRGDYGCLPVDNIYNIINPYDPVSYRLNATVDAPFAASLKPAWLPSATQSWFGASTDGWFGSSTSTTAPVRPKPSGRLDSSPLQSSTLLPRLPSNVELATHDFSREEIAEKRMLALNDNGQIDFMVRYGGGPLEIQYLTMLGAHSSYWLLRDFVRAVVVECGREPGRKGTVKGMRAVKKRSV